MVKNTLTLIVTSYNSLEYVSTFQRFLKNSAKLFEEIIIIDDCSDDGSYEQLQKIEEIYSLRLLRTKKNSGRPSEPRNIGIRNAKSSRIVFLDIDDYIPKDYLCFLANLNLDDSNIYSGTKLPINIKNFVDCYQSDTSKKLIIDKKIFRFKNLICFSGSSLPTKIAKDFSFKTRPLEDFIFWNDVLNSSADLRIIKFLDIPIGYNMNQTLSPNKFKQVKRIYEVIGAGIVIYFFLTIKMIFFEKKLMFRYKRAL